MSKNPYQIFKNKDTIMRGRIKVSEQISNHLNKASPDHISIVGPRYIGKTVLLANVDQYFQSRKEIFFAKIYWDLRHRIPDSDSDFLAAFASKIKNGLEHDYASVADYIDIAEKDIIGMIQTVFEVIEDDNKKILLILDGFDRILSCADITRNLWDNLLALSRRNSLRFMTASR
ncbi:unnamed protein product, partial [marine sediment metagenome]